METNWVTALEAAGVLVTAIFTVVLAIATIKLWISTSQLVESAERASERQLRAYVLIEKISLDDFEVGQFPTVTAHARNDGQRNPSKFR
jgi:hypothetical protein